RTRPTMPNKFPPCLACGSACTYIENPAGVLFAMKCNVCGEQSGYGRTKHEAIALWTKAAEKRRALEALAAKVPRFSKEQPDSEGPWWWLKDGGKEGDRNACHVHSWCGVLWATVHEGGCNFKVSEMGGCWAKCLPPEMPEEEEPK
ncbi:MAG: hypothetical protein ACYTFK_12900, partial [Planctomycetota bacterium]